MIKVTIADEEFRRAMGRRVRQRRLRLDLTALEVGRRAGLSSASMSHIEQGLRGLTVENLIRLARALEVRPAWFFRDLK